VVTTVDHQRRSRCEGRWTHLGTDGGAAAPKGYARAVKRIGK
jgi:hypothetical protein